MGYSEHSKSLVVKEQKIRHNDVVEGQPDRESQGPVPGETTNEGPSKGRLQGLETRLSRLRTIVTALVLSASLTGSSPAVESHTAGALEQGTPASGVQRQEIKKEETRTTKDPDTIKDINKVIDAWKNPNIEKHEISKSVLLAVNEDNPDEARFIAEIIEELKKNHNIVDWLDRLEMPIIIAQGDQIIYEFSSGIKKSSLAYNSINGKHLYIFLDTASKQPGNTPPEVVRVLVDEAGDSILHKIQKQAGIPDNFLNPTTGDGLEQPYNAALSYFLLQNGFPPEVNPLALNERLENMAFRNYGKAPIPLEYRAAFEGVMNEYLAIHPLTSRQEITFTIDVDGYGKFGGGVTKNSD